jgi:hypothetical protein
MLKPRSFSLAALAVLGAAIAVALSHGNGLAQTSPQQTHESAPLKQVDAFESIADTTARSRALFNEAAKVLTHPRCLNCHPPTRSPTQGETMHPHMPPIQAGAKGTGISGINCTSCHRLSNTPVPGSRVGSVPGAEHWLLAPASMAWQGRTVGEICSQLKDPARNGGRSLADVHKHVSTDHLVAWAWHPGDGRQPAPGTQELFGALLKAWIATGAACPQ